MIYFRNQILFKQFMGNMQSYVLRSDKRDFVIGNWLIECTICFLSNFVDYNFSILSTKHITSSGNNQKMITPLQGDDVFCHNKLRLLRNPYSLQFDMLLEISRNDLCSLFVTNVLGHLLLWVMAFFVLYPIWHES